MLSPAFEEWVIRPSDLHARQTLADGLRLHPITAAVLVARGVRSCDDAAAVLLDEGAVRPDPFLLPGMEPAIDRIHRAAVTGERVLIYGDYDVDGTSATALYVQFLNGLGLAPDFYIPHRLREGYGLNADAVRRIADLGVSLLLTVDCGTTSFDEIRLARALGLDVIVTDHHLPEETLPPAFGVLNPFLSPAGSAFQGLCSTGLGFNVASAYALKYGHGGGPAVDEHLDLVALATVADMVPLTAENRWMIRDGLRRISQGCRLGLRALKAVAGIEGTCGVGTIAYQLAPRINAAGRVGDAADAVRLMLTDNEHEARMLAERLERLNRERQQVEDRMTGEAIDALAREHAPTGAIDPIVLASRSWHPGIVGIVASRLVERYHRPAVLIAVTEEGKGRGSARSIPGVNICEGIRLCRQDLEGFGGHAAAAGLTIREQAIPRFRIRLGEALALPLLRAARRSLFCDAEIEPCGLSPAVVRDLDRLGPFGMGNPEPLLLLRRLRISSARVVGHNHLKLMVRGSRGPGLTAFGYGMGTPPEFSPTDAIDVAGSLEINTWNGTEGVQLRLKDLRTSHYGEVAIC